MSGVGTRSLGRRPPSGKVALRLADVLTGVVPIAPEAVDYFQRIPSWILGGNDKYGVCGPVSVANQRLLVSTYLSGVPHRVSQTDIFDLYRRSGNPNFDPNDPGGPGDGGVDMQTMLEEVVRNGIGGVKALAFAKVDQTNLNEVRDAIAIFGSLLDGVTLDTSQETGALWDYLSSPVWGGHAVMSGKYNEAPDRTAVISWSEIISMTDAFMSHQLDEAWVVVWPEHLGSTAFLQGINLTALATDYTALTGRPFPTISPAPVPSPTPVPTDADHVLAAAVGPWAQFRHSGANRKAATAVKAWLAAKGF